MNFISGINATSSALDAEKVRMDIVAENIANAYTTRGVDGKAYQRKTVAFESLLASGGERAGEGGLAGEVWQGHRRGG